MKKARLEQLEKNHRELMNWVMKYPFSGKRNWPEWKNQKHHFLYFYPCIIDDQYCQHYGRVPEERCSYCPLAEIKENGDIACCHGYMLEFERSLKAHDEERAIEYAMKIRDLPWKNPHDVRTRWHNLSLIRHDREEDPLPVYWPEAIPVRFVM
jgi:hypothetical protein